MKYNRISNRRTFGSNGYSKTGNKFQSIAEQDVSDINLFVYGDDNEKSAVQRKIKNRKEIYDNINKNSENRIKN